MKTIESGILTHSHGDSAEYTIDHGWDLKSSILCDKLWKESSVELLQHILDQGYPDDELLKVIESLSMEDDHWRWADKAMVMNTDEYEWMHLFAEGKPQATCVIFHPKESLLQAGRIFYIEFVAVAPWNRKCHIRDRRFLRVGKTLLKAALNYAVNDLDLSPGFSLHSLPGAIGFYEGLKMENVAQANKGNLLYYELPRSIATELLEAA